MNEPDNKPDESNTVGSSKKPYERPDIVWEEEYKPSAFGLSCAKQPGNPGCNPGPLSA
jgi:hypothetical protein